MLTQSPDNSGQLTREMFQRAIKQLEQSSNRPLAETGPIFCHPKDLWWHQLEFDWRGRRRWQAFLAFWKFRKMFNEYETMVVLSSILRGHYF